MFAPMPVRSYPADEGGPLALAKEFLIDHNLWLESLTWENTGADTAYIQIFNVPRKPSAVAITDTDMTTGLITAPSHGLRTGDAITFSSIAGLTTGYAQVANDDAFYVHSNRIVALSGALPDLFPDNDDDTGTVILTSLATPPAYEEYPVLGSGSAPSNIGSYTNAQFSRGLYVRAVTAAGGSTLVGSAVIRFTPRYLSGPLAGTPEYED